MIRVFSLLILIGLVNFSDIVSAHETEQKRNPSDYVAYRQDSLISNQRWFEIQQTVNQMGIQTIQSIQLDINRILILKMARKSDVENVEKAFPSMIRLPIGKGLYDSLTVWSGYFVMKFQENLDLGSVRARVNQAGFEIVTPDLAIGQFFVVRGTRLPENKDSELKKLKALTDLIYVFPDDIPF